MIASSLFLPEALAKSYVHLKDVASGNRCAFSKDLWQIHLVCDFEHHQPCPYSLVYPSEEPETFSSNFDHG